MLGETMRRLEELTEAIHALRAPGELPAARPARHPFLPDPQRIRDVLRQQAVFWLVALALIYIPDLPLGGAALIMAVSMSMMLVLMPSEPNHGHVAAYRQHSGSGGSLRAGRG